MGKLRGVDVVVQVNTGTEADPAWTTVGGQQDGTLNLTGNEIDVTDKDTDPGWHERLAGLRDWSIDLDGFYVTDNAAQSQLFDDWMAGNKINARFVFPGDSGYEGQAIITDITVGSPHDGAVTRSVSLQAAGKLEEIAA